MSTMPKLPVQFYDTRGVPTSPSMSREHMVDLTRAAYERSNVYLDRDIVDIHLAEVADQAACSLLRDRWKHDFPVAAYTELLATVSALRSILGYAQSPTAGDVSAWARRLWESSAAAAGDDKDFHEVQIHEGPYNEVVVVLWGPKTPQAPGMLAGPPLTLELATERGTARTWSTEPSTTSGSTGAPPRPGRRGNTGSTASIPARPKGHARTCSPPRPTGQVRGVGREILPVAFSVRGRRP